MFFSSSPERQAWLELPDGRTHWLMERTTIGRQPGNDVVLAGDTLSRQHAVIARGADGYTLSDLRSRNGTALAGTLVTRPTALRDGDEIRLGEIVVRFRCKRRMELRDPLAPSCQTTQVLDRVEGRTCWLMLVDIEGYTAVVSDTGSEAAMRKLQHWIAGARPLIERHAGRINRYVGDAIFAYWLSEANSPAEVLASLAAFEGWRAQSPLPFRLVLHHGTALFSVSDHGEEIGGRDATFTFRMEKIAKGFGSRAMLSGAAVQSLGLEGRCETYGRSAVDGMTDFFAFYALPSGLTVPGSSPP